MGQERNFSLSIWDHKDNFICLLKSSNSDFNGQTYNENFTENINGEKTLSFSIPMYIFDINSNEDYKFKPNDKWQYIFNEQKIRYIEYDLISNTPIKIEEFVLKEFSEERSGEEKIANCTCESLAVYELSKVGWGISFDNDYITDYELGYNEEQESNCPDLLTLDYWLKKIFYKETNLGRVSTTTEYTYLLQGLQLRNDEGYPISNEYIVKENGERDYEIIQEPIWTSTEIPEQYLNPTGWEWEIQATFENDPEKTNVSTLYESPVINKYIEKLPDYYEAQSYQKRIGESDDTKELRVHPIPDEDLDEWTYVTDIKRRLITIERSNIFNIIQDLSEIFEVWAYFTYEYSPDGKIIHRKIVFKTSSIDENIKFDFAYGKNLTSCSRITNSNDLITKLIVPAVESTLVDGNLLSIQQATANPTGENYIYNFDYFYKLGTFTKEESFSTESDEYKINLYYGNLRKVNNKILDLQKFLLPLYDKQSELQSDLTVQEGAKIGYMENIQTIQNKIDAIPPEDQIIESWSADNSQYNHVGPVKTYSTTTRNGEEYQYLNFGRDDIIGISWTTSLDIEDYIIIDDEITTSTRTFSIEGYTPRSFIYSQWRAGDDAIDENDTSSFYLFTEDNSDVIYDYSELGDNIFIKGIYFRGQDRGTYGRIRYKYAPLAYYYLMIEDYWDKINKVQQEIDELKNKVIEINNKILTYELDLKKFLNNKKELILQFEKDYKPFIREGTWEPSDYQSQINNKYLDTNNSSNFDGLFIKTYNLSELNLNDSLHNYTYYIKLEDASEIDIDSIEMTTISNLSGISTVVPRYRGHDFEIYKSSSEDSFILGISPEFIDKIDADLINTYNKTSILKYVKNNEQISESIEWTEITENNNPSISEYYIYISNDNILTDSLKIYGGSSDIADNQLIIYEDYIYNFESTVYDTSTGQRVDIEEWDFNENDTYYDYSLKIEIKLTNNTLKFLNTPRFFITYTEDSTLQYLYNDSVATSDKYSIPQVEYNISVIDLSSLNGYEYYKPKLGQKVPIWDIEMGFKGFEGFITSISYNLEQKENTEITIATYNTRFEDIFQKLTATMSDVSYNENKIYNAANSIELNGTIRKDVFKKSLEDNFDRILLGVDNDIIIDKRNGITLRDNDTSNAVKIIGNGIFLTDNFNSENVQWKTGITGEGINAGALTAGNIDTKQINIWNSGEDQIRFMWNDQGLIAYGDGQDLSISTSTATTSDLDKIIDYNKYIKFNQNGLDFNDNGKSALSLGWTGLKINTQNNSLALDADKGLVLTQWEDNNAINRLQLGKLDNGNIYGLKLKDASGSTVFQSDSDGNLWLSKFINVGGNFDDSGNSPTYKPINPTAGIVGITTDNVHYQMGVMRDTSSGDVIFKTTQLRFWAGPQTKQQYLINLSLSTSDIENLSDWNNLNDNDPALAKFKVDSEGNIVASGIDVGGWIGAGKILRSKNFEAILRSDGYEPDNDEDEYPVFAIGTSTETNDARYHNFRVYQDGTLNIGNGQFIATSTGSVIARNININSSNSNISGGQIGNWTINNTGIEIISGIYKTGMYAVANSEDLAIQIGDYMNPAFSVDGNGKMIANSGFIGGWKIGVDKLYKEQNDNWTALFPNSGIGTSTDPVIYIGNKNSSYLNDTNTKFKVSSDGSVFFHGGIYGWSNTANNNIGGFKKGLTESNVTQLYTTNGSTIDIEICQGLIIDMR